MAISAPVEKRTLGLSLKKMRKIFNIPTMKEKGFFAKLVI
jgi:hypothetical protein